LTGPASGPAGLPGRRPLTAANHSQKGFNLASKRRVVRAFNRSRFRHRNIDVPSIDFDELEHRARVTLHQFCKVSQPPRSHGPTENQQNQPNLHKTPRRVTGPRDFKRREINLLGFDWHGLTPHTNTLNGSRIHYRQNHCRVN
jgi:hypothetical protein